MGIFMIWLLDILPPFFDGGNGRWGGYWQLETKLTASKDLPINYNLHPVSKQGLLSAEIKHALTRQALHSLSFPIFLFPHSTLAY